MLSLWLDPSTHRLEELLPSSHRLPVKPEVQQLLEAVRALQLTTPVQRHDAGLDPTTLSKLFELGLFSLTVPRDYGGHEAGWRDFVLVMEQIGSLGPAWAMTAVPHLCISVKAITRYVEPKQAAQILTKIRQDHSLLAFAITEEHGSDVAAMHTRLQKNYLGGFTLNGRKQWITNLERASHVVVACLCPDLHSAPGASVLVLVDLQQAGVRVSRPWDKVCVNGSDTSDLFFDQVEIPTQHILTKPGQGMNAFLEMVQPGRLATAAACIGLTRRAVNHAKQDLAHTTASPAQIEFFEDVEAQLAALSAGLRLCASFAEERHYDHTHLISLMKFICGELCQELMLEIDHLYALERKTPALEFANHREALGLFRLLKGPGEILAWQTVLAWSAIVLNEMKGKLEWPSDLHEAAYFITSHMLALRSAGGPHQRPMMVEGIARGLAYWWLLLSCYSLAQDGACELDKKLQQRALRWARARSKQWQTAETLSTTNLSNAEIDTLFQHVLTSSTTLFQTRLELQA